MKTLKKEGRRTAGRRLASVSCLPAFLFSCLAAHAGGVQPFTEEAVGRGVVYVMQAWPLTYGHFGFGCGFVDLDADGDQDIVVIGALSTRVGIFENDGGPRTTEDPPAAESACPSPSRGESPSRSPTTCLREHPSTRCRTRRATTCP